MEKTWLWNRFDGLNDTDYEGLGNLYSNASYNIDTRTSPGGVKLTSAYTTYLSTDQIPRVIIDLERFGGSGVVTCLDNGKIYLDTTLKHTLTATNKEIWGATVMEVSGTKYIYFFTDDKIHKSTLDFVTVTENVATINTTDKRPLLNIDGEIYFGNKNELSLFDSTETVTDKITLPSNELIVGLTTYQDQIKIYVNAGGTNPISGRQYFWDKSAASWNYVSEWENTPFLGVSNAGPNDYVVTGYNSAYSDLYISSGTQRQLIHANREGEASRRFTGAMCMRFDDVYIAGTYSYGMIYKFGKYYPSQNQTLSPDYKFPTNSVVYSITPVGAASLYAGIYNGSSYEVVKFELNTTPGTNYYASDGEIVSGIFEGEALFTNKTLKSFHIASDGTPGVIKLYARKDVGSSFTLLYTWTNSSADRFKRIDPTELIAAGFGNFNYLQLKARIEPGTSGGNNVYSPMFRGILTTYDDNISR